jgi:hypothetical protein
MTRAITNAFEELEETLSWGVKGAEMFMKK